MALTTQEARERKQAQLERLVAEAEGLLGLAEEHPEDQAILATKAETIVNNIKGRQWTSEAVTSAFSTLVWAGADTKIRAACAAHRKTNCLTEVLFAEALEKARALDKELAAGAEPQGPFYGLPSSFKDTFNVVGVDTSLGCSPYCFDPTTDPEDEANLVRLFRAGGGIPMCKTGIPQTLLAFECSNPIFGTTSNPYDSGRTCGGSSGGEAALVTLRGTPLGWGSDIGGSLRIPALYSGCCGLKPTVGRWAFLGCRPVTRGQEGIIPTNGPMAANVDDLTYAAKSMMDLTTAALAARTLAAENLLPIPWREPALPARLRIGVYRETGMVRTSPALLRALDETVAALRRAGHDVVEYAPPPLWRVFEVFCALSSADGYRQLLANLGPDPKEPSMVLVTAGSSVPRWLLALASKAIHYLAGDPTFARIVGTSHGKTIPEYQSWIARRADLAREFKRKVWEDEKFDFLLGPPQAVPALEHGRTKTLSPLAIGTCVFNVMDTTAGVLPVTRVKAELDGIPEGWLNIDDGEVRSTLLEKRVYGADDPAYDAQKMAGLPVGVQVVGRQWDEEGVLACMKIIEGLVNYE